jgi:hypothetical protein
MDAIRTFDIPYLEIDYDEFLDAPERVVCRLSDFFGISVTAAELNVRRELNHSYLRGRLSGALRMLTRVLPARPKHAIKRIVPQSVIDALYPEKKLARRVKDVKSATRRSRLIPTGHRQRQSAGSLSSRSGAPADTVAALHDQSFWSRVTARDRACRSQPLPTCALALHS